MVWFEIEHVADHKLRLQIPLSETGYMVEVTYLLTYEYEQSWK